MGINIYHNANAGYLNILVAQGAPFEIRSHPSSIHSPVTEMPKANVRAAEIEERYQAALEAFRLQFRRNGRRAQDHFEELFGDSSFLKHSFFQERFSNDKKKTAIKDKLALIAAHSLLPVNSLANQIFEQIIAKEQRGPLTDRYDGFYRYWRYYPTEHKLDPVRWGVIELKTEAGVGTRFSHWSHDWIERKSLRKDDQPVEWAKFKDPEDLGFAFFTHRRMFFLAFRTDNIRLAISSLPDSPKDEAITNGIVLTTRKGSGGVFAAGFVLVHQNNKLSYCSMSHDQFDVHLKMAIRPDMYIIHD